MCPASGPKTCTVAMRSNGSQNSLLVSLLRCARLLTQELEREHGMSHARIRILAKLQRAGVLLQRDLQDHLEIDGAAVSRQLRALESEGLLERRVSATDFRQMELRLTSAGQHQAQLMIARRKAFEEKLLAELSADQQADFRQMLEFIQQQLEKRRSQR